jgi:hypothetical protein
MRSIFRKRTWVALLLALLGGSLLSVTGAAPALAASCPITIPAGQFCSIQGGRTEYSLTELVTYTNSLNPGGPVASCSNSGGTCTLTVGEALTTQIGTSLGVSKSILSAGISFSVSQTSSTAVSCSSPKLKKGQTYVAYRLGTAKFYKVRKRTANVGKFTTTLSGLKESWQPQKGVHVRCAVV